MLDVFIYSTLNKNSWEKINSYLYVFEKITNSLARLQCINFSAFVRQFDEQSVNTSSGCSAERLNLKYWRSRWPGHEMPWAAAAAAPLCI